MKNVADEGPEGCGIQVLSRALSKAEQTAAS